MSVQGLGWANGSGSYLGMAMVASVQRRLSKMTVEEEDA